MKARLKVLRKLVGQREFSNLVACGMFLSKELEYLEQHIKGENTPTQEQLEAYYEAENSHVQNYKEEAARKIQNLADGITESNAQTLLNNINEKVNGSCPNFKTICLNVASALIWDLILLIIGVIAVVKSDTIFALFVTLGKYLAQFHGIN